MEAADISTFIYGSADYLPINQAWFTDMKKQYILTTGPLYIMHNNWKTYTKTEARKYTLIGAWMRAIVRGYGVEKYVL